MAKIEYSERPSVGEDAEKLNHSYGLEEMRNSTVILKKKNWQVSYKIKHTYTLWCNNYTQEFIPENWEFMFIQILSSKQMFTVAPFNSQQSWNNLDPHTKLLK